MTDNPGGFAPPSQPFAPTPPVQAPPPGYYVPQRAYTPPPPPTPPRKLPGLAIAGIVVGVVAILGGIVAGVSVVASKFGEFVAETPDDASYDYESLVEGTPSEPLAVDSDDCANDCFGYASWSTAWPSAKDLDTLGLTYDNVDGEPDASLLQAQTLEWRAWEVANGGPADCFAASARLPVTSEFGDTEDLDRKMFRFDSSVSDDWGSTTLTQRLRFFENSTLAVDHMVALDEELSECDTFTKIEWEYESEYTVTRAPELDVPDNVAALGWVLSYDGERSYIFDIQRGNYVVRTIVDSWDGLTEQEYRSMVTDVAERVSEMHYELDPK